LSNIVDHFVLFLLAIVLLALHFATTRYSFDFANIKELNADQETLTKARDILMENAGINIAVEAIAYIRGVRPFFFL
jgi:hypothetical protein